VKALTGVDTDTQAEEKRRGMTIDIGFAFLTAAITLVDVPGHDRFVKNMVRGVAGIHLGLVVVAADDGVMPQTREHLHILRFLGVPRIVVALNKIDLAEGDLLDLVEEDIRDLLAGTPYEGAPILRVSAEKGAGIEPLRQMLLDEAANLPGWVDRGFFRLSIDRVFSIKGFGTIVTGAVLSGALEEGGDLELLPGNQAVKVRGIQSHGKKVNRVGMGDRAALNVGNLTVKELARGEQLATPGYVRTPASLAVNLTLLENAPPLPHNHPVRVDVGTKEVMAHIKLPAGKKLAPGQQAAAILDLAEPTPVIVGDRFILRSYSPVTTIGGGTVLDLDIAGRWKERRQWVGELAGTPEQARLALIISRRKARPFTLRSLAADQGWSPAAMRERLPEGTVALGRQENPWLLTPEQDGRLQTETLAIMRAYHEAHPYSSGANREHIRQRLDADDRFVEVWLRALVDRGRLAFSAETWRLPSFAITLSKAEEANLDRLVALAKSEGFETGGEGAWAAALGLSTGQTKTLILLAEARGELVRISPQYRLHRQFADQLVAGIGQHFEGHRELSVADLKAITGTSRKYTVPLLEYLDRNGHTIRIGDKRVQPDG